MTNNRAAKRRKVLDDAQENLVSAVEQFIGDDFASVPTRKWLADDVETTQGYMQDALTHVKASKDHDIATGKFWRLIKRILQEGVHHKACNVHSATVVLVRTASYCPGCFGEAEPGSLDIKYEPLEGWTLKRTVTRSVDIITLVNSNALLIYGMCKDCTLECISYILPSRSTIKRQVKQIIGLGDIANIVASYSIMSETYSCLRCEIE